MSYLLSSFSMPGQLIWYWSVFCYSAFPFPVLIKSASTSVILASGLVKDCHRSCSQSLNSAQSFHVFLWRGRREMTMWWRWKSRGKEGKILQLGDMSATWPCSPVGLVSWAPRVSGSPSQQRRDNWAPPGFTHLMEMHIHLIMQTCTGSYLWWSSQSADERLFTVRQALFEVLMILLL